ncbi:phospholipase B1, membrane-associated-like [Watersipora subatra]|uniref:phospholipase B1, membrane-associated-like n=1 Tax=Watersipora subatra TaxID=2589382 RepID=UPI00355B4587
MSSCLLTVILFFGIWCIVNCLEPQEAAGLFRLRRFPSENGQPSDLEPVGPSFPPGAAQPVSSRPITAQPVSSRPISAQPVSSRPITAQQVTVRPVIAGSVIASSRLSQPNFARPMVAVNATAVQPIMPVIANAAGCLGSFTSSGIPTSVHRLRAGDIKVVAAMGDSITAGNGAQATNVFGVLREDRGHAFSIGGDRSLSEGVTTLPNILKAFNEDIYGFSTSSGSGSPQFNVGEAGATAKSMAGQAVRLLARLQADRHINYMTDWKVITLLVGGNDLCNSCINPVAYSAAAYKDGIERALDILHRHLPRTLVNLVEVFDINMVASLANSNILCSLVIGGICPCGAGLNVNRVALGPLATEYRKAIFDLVGTGKYDTRPDFSVVIQPFLSQLTLPTMQRGRPDLSYFAPDCFHLSGKGQRAAGKALWNNMMQPTRLKQMDLLPTAPISCPSTLFIPTRHN